MPNTKVFTFLSLMTLTVLSFRIQLDMRAMMDKIRHESNRHFNERPIVGILAQPSAFAAHPPEKFNYIAASYIKFVEAAGARAVPINWDLPKADLAKIMGQINGLLLPGGGTDATDASGNWTPYYYTSRYLVELAEESNKNGIYFPVWATCQGFQYLAQIYANDSKVLGKGFNDNNINHEQKFTEAAKTSRLFSALPEWMRTEMENHPVVNYYHNYGVEPAVFYNNTNLVNSLNILSTSKTNTGREYIAAFEHKVFPFYGVQYHPEKAPYEWIEANGATHGVEAIYVTQYIQNFFGLEARRNMNKFASQKEEYDALIYNYNTVQTGSYFSHTYFFNVYNSTNVATE